jgi:hypothetical protein
VNAGYTLLARLDPSRVEDARKLLVELDADPARLPFADSPTTHFATLTVVPAQMYRGEELPALLLVATSFCGPTEIHVGELVRVMGAGLREVFAHCVEFSAACSDAELEAFILAHRHDDTFYSGMQNLSPEDVRRHRRLREVIEDFLDERQARGGVSGTALAIRAQIQDHVRSRPELAWASESFAPPPGTFMALHGRTVMAGAVILPFLAALLVCSVCRWCAPGSFLGGAACYLWLVLGLVVAFLAVLVISVRFAELRQTYVAPRQPDEHVRMLAATQNRPVINEMTIAGPIKEEGILRPLFMRIALWIVARAAEGIPGIPVLRDGINIPTVATARWIAADRGKRLIFISNYTNAAEPYVRDFIDVENGAKRINLTFGFGRGYPKTEWVVEGGALADPNSFIYVVTANQQPTAFWYGPYRDFSIDNIKLERTIREGLFARFDEHQAQAWLHLL